jgi:hypothetical protein
MYKATSKGSQRALASPAYKYSAPERAKKLPKLKKEKQLTTARDIQARKRAAKKSDAKVAARKLKAATPGP